MSCFLLPPDEGHEGVRDVPGVWFAESVGKGEGREESGGGGWMCFEDCERGLLKGVLVGGGKAVFVCMCMYVCIDV